MAHFIASAKTEVKLKLVTKIFGQDYDIAGLKTQTIESDWTLMETSNLSAEIEKSRKLHNIFYKISFWPSIITFPFYQ